MPLEVQGFRFTIDKYHRRCFVLKVGKYFKSILKLLIKDAPEGDISVGISVSKVVVSLTSTIYFSIRNGS